MHGYNSGFLAHVGPRDRRGFLPFGQLGRILRDVSFSILLHGTLNFLSTQRGTRSLINHAFLPFRSRRKENGNRIGDRSIRLRPSGRSSFEYIRERISLGLSALSQGPDIATLRTYKLPYEIPCLFNRIEYISPRHERRPPLGGNAVQPHEQGKRIVPPAGNRQPEGRGIKLSRKVAISKSIRSPFSIPKHTSIFRCIPPISQLFRTNRRFRFPSPDFPAKRKIMAIMEESCQLWSR